MKYADKLKDPRWQKKRLLVLEAREWTCQNCYDTESTLHVHHRFYINGLEPWEYEDFMLVVLCETCHQYEHDDKIPVEQNLILNIRKQFINKDIIDISDGLANINMPHDSGITAAAIKWALCNENIMSSIIIAFFCHLKQKPVPDE